MLVVCPSCSQQFVHPNAVAGSVASCPHCQATVTIPSANRPIPVFDTLGSKSKTSGPALALGVISVIVGALALLFSWIPLVGLLVIPFAVIGGTLGLVGLVIGLITRRKAFGMPITGVVLCVSSAFFPALMIAGAFMNADPDATPVNASEQTAGKALVSANPDAAAAGASEQAGDEDWSFETTKPEPINRVKSPMRTWTNKEGRELEAELIRLFKMDGVFHGEFLRPSGDVFTYKIGNFSQADIQFVKDLQAKSTN